MIIGGKMSNFVKIITRVLIVLGLLCTVQCSRFQQPENVSFLTSLENKTLYCPVWDPNDKIYWAKADVDVDGETEKEKPQPTTRPVATD